MSYYYGVSDSKSFYVLSGISERVADIKTRGHAMKCLTAFCEAVGPGFVFERVRENTIGSPNSSISVKIL